MFKQNKTFLVMMKVTVLFPKNMLIRPEIVDKDIG